MCFGGTRKCISPRLPQQHKDGGKERKKGGENKEERKKTNMFGNRKQEREKEDDKHPLEKTGEDNSQGRTGEGGGRKHSVCKSQIKSISVLHTEPCPGGNMALSA